MFEEAQLYSPVETDADGAVRVQLARSHPGFGDAEYRARRDAIAAAAVAWKPGTPPPQIDYTEGEDEIWRTVCRELRVQHERWACREVLEAKGRFGLPEDRVPQLSEVTARLAPLTGFEYHPAAGLVPLREFYGSLADGVFHSTQYVRHGARPLYTPEPDVVHEVIGHGTLLASERFAALKRAAGRAAQRVETEAALQVVADVFWFTIEFGVVREDGEAKAYGAGLLSSFGEIQELERARLRPLDIAAMATQEYDITAYQPVLFCADSLGELEEVAGGFFDGADDDTPARLGVALAQH